MFTNYSTPYILLLVAVILFIILIENILRFEFFVLENQQQSDFIMIEQVFDISKLVSEECTLRPSGTLLFSGIPLII